MDDLELEGTLSTIRVSKHMLLSEPTTKIWMKICPYYQRQRCSPMTLDSGNIRFMRIFTLVLNSQDLCKSSLDLRMPVSIYYYTGMVCQCSTRVHVFDLWHCREFSSAWPAEMWSSGLWSAEYFKSVEKLRIFRRRYVVGILTNNANICIYLALGLVSA